MENQDCIFCRIIRGDVPAPRVYEDDQVICIRDVHPQAPTHLLLIPKRHAETLLEFCPPNHAPSFDFLSKAAQVARTVGIAETGFRTVINTGARGGQSVFHLHAHLLGGARLKGEFGA